MKVERFDPETDGASVRACHEIYLSGLPDDDPLGPPMTPRVFAGWLALGFTQDPVETWLARDVRVSPAAGTRSTFRSARTASCAGLSLVVHAARRRAGRGTALLRHAAGRAGEVGRTVLETEARESSPGAAFAGTLKARSAVTAVRRVLRPGGRARGSSGPRCGRKPSPPPSDTRCDPGSVRRPRTPSPGSPPQRGDGRRAPRSPGRRSRSGTWPGSGWTSTGSRPWDCVPTWSWRRRQATGDLAALTQVCVDPAMPEWGFQELTAVARPHRGHRLGLLLKLAMLDLLAAREPQVTRIITGNAVGQRAHDRHQRAALVSGVLGRWPSWELDVADVPADLAGRA